MAEEDNKITIIDAVSNPKENAENFNRQQCLKGAQLETFRRFRNLYNDGKLEGGTQQMVGTAKTAYHLHRNFLGEEVITQSIEDRYRELQGDSRAAGVKFETIESFQEFVDPEKWKIEDGNVEGIDERLDTLDSLFVKAIEIASSKKK